MKSVSLALNKASYLQSLVFNDRLYFAGNFLNESKESSVFGFLTTDSRIRSLDDKEFSKLCHWAALYFIRFPNTCSKSWKLRIRLFFGGYDSREIKSICYGAIYYTNSERKT